MTKRTTQDDIREVSQARQFNLELTQGRSNKYLPDAKLKYLNRVFDVELKTCNANNKKGSISTARGVNMKKIDEWRKVQLWIFSKHVNDKLTGEHYVLSNKNMEFLPQNPIFWVKVVLYVVVGLLSLYPTIAEGLDTSSTYTT